MKIKTGDKVTYRNGMGDDFVAYFQQWDVSNNHTYAIVLFESGKAESVSLFDLNFNTEDNRNNIIREFIGFAAENIPPTTELINLALREIQK
jgi:hypothetical protein